MKSKHEYTDYFEDIIGAVVKARKFVKDIDFEAFRANEEKVFAVIRALEIKRTKYKDVNLLSPHHRIHPSFFSMDDTRI